MELVIIRPKHADQYTAPITPEYSISGPGENRRLLPLSLKELHSAIFFNLPVCPYHDRTDVNVWVSEC